jgi:glucosamine-6-phosphate deaminase
MGLNNSFNIAPAPWLPQWDAELLDRVAAADLNNHVGSVYENPNFTLQVCGDVHNYFATDLFQRIRMSDVRNEKLVLILPSPETAVYISLAENLNKLNVSCRNVHVFFLLEYANEKGEVAPWQSPFSRSGHFMRYFYQRLNPELRMPMEQIHFWTRDNADTYSDLLAAEGGADVAYTYISWASGIGAIDFESFPAQTMDELLQMGSRLVTPAPETIAHDSLRGMFGCSGDITSVPPCAVTIGPRDLAAAREHVCVNYLISVAGSGMLQAFPVRLCLLGPVEPRNTGSMIRLFPGTCYITESIARAVSVRKDNLWLDEVVAKARKEEE